MHFFLGFIRFITFRWVDKFYNLLQLYAFRIENNVSKFLLKIDLIETSFNC